MINRMLILKIGDVFMDGHDIWEKMRNLEGEEFLTVTGKMFTYKISGDKFKTSRTNMWLSKNDLMKAVSMFPFKSVSEISGVVIGPSYIYAILNDKRINCDMDQNSAKIMSIPPLKKSDVIDKPLSSIGQAKGIKLGGLIFKQTPIRFKKFDIKDTFSGFNKYTLEEMISRERYSGLANETKNHYQRNLSQRTGEFLLQLKEENDPFYKRFLNRFGDNSFCHFELTDVVVFEKRGLYAYYLNDKICYIGRCRDNFYSRFNLNYGKIHPINCYREGQSTNCHINALLNRHREQIAIYLCPIQSLQEIEETELKLIRKYVPDWNIKK